MLTASEEDLQEQSELMKSMPDSGYNTIISIPINQDHKKLYSRTQKVIRVLSRTATTAGIATLILTKYRPSPATFKESVLSGATTWAIVGSLVYTTEYLSTKSRRSIVAELRDNGCGYSLIGLTKKGVVQTIAFIATGALTTLIWYGAEIQGSKVGFSYNGWWDKVAIEPVAGLFGYFVLQAMKLVTIGFLDCCTATDNSEESNDITRGYWQNMLQMLLRFASNVGLIETIIFYLSLNHAALQIINSMPCMLPILLNFTLDYRYHIKEYAETPQIVIEAAETDNENNQQQPSRCKRAMTDLAIQSVYAIGTLATTWGLVQLAYTTGSLQLEQGTSVKNQVAACGLLACGSLLTNVVLNTIAPNVSKSLINTTNHVASDISSVIKDKITGLSNCCASFFYRHARFGRIPQQEFPKEITLDPNDYLTPDSPNI